MILFLIVEPSTTGSYNIDVLTYNITQFGLQLGTMGISMELLILPLLLVPGIMVQVVQRQKWNLRTPRQATGYI